MDSKRYSLQRIASIHVEPYLAIYAKKKFAKDPATGAIKIPDTFDLYHCVWQVMRRRPMDTKPLGDENLQIWLPARRCAEGVTQKNPAYWNYISPRGARHVENQLRRLFNWEFHHYCEENLAMGVSKVDTVRNFIRQYGFSLDSEDALLKNLQRYQIAMSTFLNIKMRKNKKRRKI